MRRSLNRPYTALTSDSSQPDGKNMLTPGRRKLAVFDDSIRCNMAFALVKTVLFGASLALATAHPTAYGNAVELKILETAQIDGLMNSETPSPAF